MKRFNVIFLSVLLLGASMVQNGVNAAYAQSAESQEPAPAQPGGQAATQDRPFSGRFDQEPEIRSYDRVITKDAKSTPGVFTVHRIKSKVYYEIPKGELDKEFLWVSQIAKTTLGSGYGGQAAGNRVVRWERRGNRVLLRNVAYEIVADSKLPISRAVQAANNDTILMSFFIEALGKEDAPVIDVTRLFTTEVTEFSARTRLRARGFDPSRSFVERIASFPRNIEVEATHTFTSPPDLGGGGVAQIPTNPFAPAGMAPGSATVLMHYSMVKLP
jgi:hypothetical protein